MKVGRVSALAGLISAVQAAAVNKDAVPFTQGPMQKVIMLLDSMTHEIKSEMEEQAEISKKLQCWAKTNKDQKETALAANTQLVKEKEAEINKLTAQNAEEAIKIKTLTEDIAKNQKSLTETEELRKKEADTFAQFENDTRKAIQQLGGALGQLEKFNAFTQMSAADKVALSVALKRVGEKYAMALDSEDVTKAKSFLQTEHSPAASQSGEIFGILSQMKETMEADLLSQTTDETKAVAEFQKIREAKRTELKSQNDELFSTKKTSARTKNALQQARKTVKEATATIDADQEFLADVIARSAANQKELDARVTAQTEELTAISECKKILVSDDSRAQLQKTVKKTFVQTNFLQVSSMKSRRDRAVALLMKTGNPQLQLLATQVGINAFKKIKQAINDLVAELKKKKEDQYKKRDYCVAALDENKAQTAEAEFRMQDLDGLISTLETEIEVVSKKIEDGKKNISDLEIDVAIATDTRKKENAEYQQVFNDQTVTVAILAKAKQKLTQFYEKKSLVQQPGGPVGLKEGGYKKQGGGGVIQMLNQIIADARKTIELARTDEQAAQVAYDTVISAAHKDMKTLQNTLVTDNETKAKKEQALVNGKSDSDSTLTQLKSLTNANADLTLECEFMMKNFDETQVAMAQEIEALQGAINILAGAM